MTSKLWPRKLHHYRPKLVTPSVSKLLYNSAVRKISSLQITFLVLLASSFAMAQSNPTPTTPAAPDTTHATCGDKPPLASRTVRTELFVSPDGKHRAYAENEAHALYPQRPAGYSGPLCVNSSRLFVANESPDYKIVFLQEPSDIEAGNSLRPVDWSADSRRLLLELAEWQYEAPGVTRSIVIYDARNGTFQQPDFPRIFHKLFERECSLDIRVSGFTAEGKIVFDSEPLTPEEEEVFAVPSCSRKKETYEMDRTTETIVSVPTAPKLQRNAKTEPPVK